MDQKACIVRTGPAGHDGLKKLNVQLERGWRVAHVTAMGGSAANSEAPSHAALVVLERRDRTSASPAAAVAALEEIGTETEQAVEQVVESADDLIDGNGADPAGPASTQEPN